MSVNIYNGTTLTPIAGLTVPAPTPDYVDEQFDSSKTYSKGMTCIEGNVRYRYKNSTATSGHRPPNTTYWEVLSVASQLGEGWMEVIATVEGSLDTADIGYNIKSVSVAVTTINKYKFLMLSVYKTTDIQYGTYMPSNTTVGLRSDFSISDGIGHYIQAFNPQNLQQMAQLSFGSPSCTLSYIDYSKTNTKGKAVLYGMN